MKSLCLLGALSLVALSGCGGRYACGPTMSMFGYRGDACDSCCGGNMYGDSTYYDGQVILPSTTTTLPGPAASTAPSLPSPPPAPVPQP